MTISEVEITTAYETLAGALQRAREEGEKEIIAKRDWEAQRATATLDGRIEGKNEAAREAAARLALTCWFSRLQECETSARLARHELDMARLAVEQLRLRMRLVELLAQGGAE